ncbi:hypothetical protein UUU_02770 [Klebsiella pneumoniae subsp. pneumoniae DSM 30104 = JCM 1662 = NBRC 14940]|nr:hypothetical protein UUU_02770 [Klebsiella pneumoniae subsp. pneumoniae DSM 30104 = JCM 1662 = NBRC 14940]
MVIAHFLLFKSMRPTKVTTYRNRELKHAYDPSHIVAVCRHSLTMHSVQCITPIGRPDR